MLTQTHTDTQHGFILSQICQSPAESIPLLADLVNMNCSYLPDSHAYIVLLCKPIPACDRLSRSVTADQSGSGLWYVSVSVWD